MIEEATEAAPERRGTEDGRLLMVPGPTNLSKRVRQAMSQPQVGHMDVDYADEFSETLKLARRAFRNNDGHQFILTGSGTIGMEICVTSIVSPGDKVLALNTGYFGQRMVDINRWYGAKVEGDTDRVRRDRRPGRCPKEAGRGWFQGALCHARRHEHDDRQPDQGDREGGQGRRRICGGRWDLLRGGDRARVRQAQG